jgi:hypothetical protein
VIDSFVKDLPKRPSDRARRGRRPDRLRDERQRAAG